MYSIRLCSSIAVVVEAAAHPVSGRALWVYDEGLSELLPEGGLGGDANTISIHYIHPFVRPTLSPKWYFHGSAQLKSQISWESSW